jgi:enoyl-CoA hydratase
MGVGDRVRGDGLPAQRLHELLALAGGAGVDDHVAEEVRVDPVAGGERDLEHAVGDLMHAATISFPPMSDQPVLTERRDGVLLITLNRPEARNAVNLPLAEGVAAALDDLDGSDDVSVGILTGAGGGFCAGMDLKAFVSGERPWVGERGFAGIVQKGPRKPIIAAIEGFAVAGGLEVALACDLIVAARGAKLGIPEVKRSLVAAGGALLRLPQRIPYGLAMELALTGDLITAERGAEVGLVDRLAEPGGAVDTALELAAAIAKNGPLALTATKEVLAGQRDWEEAEFWAKQGEITGPVFVSNDAREGAVAFSEKREPQWTGT